MLSSSLYGRTTAVESEQVYHIAVNPERHQDDEDDEIEDEFMVSDNEEAEDFFLAPPAAL